MKFRCTIFNIESESDRYYGYHVDLFSRPGIAELDTSASLQLTLIVTPINEVLAVLYVHVYYEASVLKIQENDTIFVGKFCFLPLHFRIVIVSSIFRHLSY